MTEVTTEQFRTKPAEINRAIALFMLSLLLGLLKTAIDWPHVVAVGGGGSFVVAVAVGTLLLFTWLIWKIAQGRNWARITSAVLFLLGLIPFPWAVATEIHRSPLSAVFMLVQAIIQLYANALLFTSSGRRWFLPKRVTEAVPT